MSKRLTKEYFENLSKERNHVLLDFGNYSGVKSKLKFKCLLCGHIWSTTAASYINSKTGCWGCKKSQISKTHSNKNVTLQTRLLLSKKAQQRTNHWHQLSPEDWHREDTLYLVLIHWNGKDVVKIGRSFDGAMYHKKRLKYIFGEWKAPSFWVWWVEKIIKRIFIEYRYVDHDPKTLKGLTGHTECFTENLDVSRIILVIEKLMTRQSAGKP